MRMGPLNLPAARGDQSLTIPSWPEGDPAMTLARAIVLPLLQPSSSPA
jgi:hypothetical protein